MSVDYEDAYIIQVRSTNGGSKHWHNTGREYFSSPILAKEEKMRMEAEHAGKKEFRVAKFVFAFVSNGCGAKER